MSAENRPRLFLDLAVLLCAVAIAGCGGDDDPEEAGNASSGGNGTATLQWRAPTTRTDGAPLQNLTGYRIRYGQAPGEYSQSIDVPGAQTGSHTIGGLAKGTHYFVVLALDANGLESPMSIEVSKTVQ